MPQVRVIAEDGAQLGILPVREALALAQEKSLDLVEVSPTARPPVCRIMDYGKFKYEQSKRERTARKKQHVQQLKEVKLRPKIDDHDFDFKIQHAREFLTARDKVKITLTFRGREMAHPELGHQMMQRVIADLADLGSPESIPRSEGRTLVMVVMPKPAKTGGGTAPAKPAAPGAAAAASKDGKPATPAAPAARPATKPAAPAPATAPAGEKAAEKTE